MDKGEPFKQAQSYELYERDGDIEKMDLTKSRQMDRALCYVLGKC